MADHRWRQRGWICAAVAGCALLALFGGSASAASSLTAAGELTVDSTAHAWNGSVPVKDGNYQYYGYWDKRDESGNVYLKVTRRNITAGTTTEIRFDGTGSTAAQRLARYNDGHNSVALGISPNDDRIHLSWSDHGGAANHHHYGISNAGCATQATFTTCTFTWSNGVGEAPESHEDPFTYPVYFNDNDGVLYLAFRDGVSTKGDQWLEHYDDDGTWTEVGIVLEGGANGTVDSYDSDGEGPIPSTNQRGPYVLGWAFDKNNDMHVTWSWREYSEWGGVPHHDIYHAYSTDGGRTWQDDRGNTVAVLARNDTIRASDTSTLAVSSPPGYWAMGHSYNMALDSNNQPHIAIAASHTLEYDQLDAEMCQKHYWRTEDSTARTVQWYSGFIESETDCNQKPQWGNLMFDRGDVAYVVYGRMDFDWVPWNSDIYAQAELPNPNVTLQEGRYMDVQLASSTTELDTADYVGTSISTAGNTQIRVRMRNNTSANEVSFAWTTDADPEPGIGKTQTFRRAINARDRNYTEYTFTITDADWTGTLRTLAFAPARGASSESVSIDWIRITDRSGAVAKAWEFNTREGQRIVAAQASPAGNWGTWTVENIVDAEGTDTIGDGVMVIDDQAYADNRDVDFLATRQGAVGTTSLIMHEFTIRGDEILKDWGFDVTDMFWSSANQVTSYGWASDGGEGSVGGSISGSDPQIVSATSLKVAVGSEKTISVRLKNTSSARRARISFITDADRTWNEAKSKSFTITENSGYTNYTVDMTGVSGWERSTLYQLRLDPMDDGTSRGSFNVSRVYITR